VNKTQFEDIKEKQNISLENRKSELIMNKSDIETKIDEIEKELSVRNVYKYLEY
jgi:hypothetical protein